MIFEWLLKQFKLYVQTQEQMREKLGNTNRSGIRNISKII